MSFAPVLPATVLIGVAILLIAMRALTLREALRHTGSRRYAPLLRWSGLTAAVLLFVLAGARPVIGHTGSASATVASGTENVNVFLVVDRSVDSRVEDFGPNTSRMAGIRNDITTLVGTYPRARFALISFSSRASVDWPLSNDLWSLRAKVVGLQAYTAESPDTTYHVSAAAASDVLRYKLQQAQFGYPHSANLVFYFGEGAGGSRAPQGEFDLGSAKVAGGAVFGYGTPSGGPIPQAVVNGDLVYAADAQTGAPLSSAINEPALRAIAEQLGVPYVHRVSGASAEGAIVHAGGSTGAVAASGVELYWVFSLAAAALIAVEIFLTIRQFRRTHASRGRQP